MPLRWRAIVNGGRHYERRTVADIITDPAYPASAHRYRRGSDRYHCRRRTLPRRGGDIELQQQSVNVGGCALNIAVALKRLGIDASNALPLGRGVWAERIRRRLAKEGLSSVIDAVEGDNGWCLALVEPDGERTFMSLAAWKTSGMRTGCRSSGHRGAVLSTCPAINWPRPVASH